jgi:uncharacterized protein (TIGR00297 family)
VSEKLRISGKTRPETARKSFHIAAGTLAAASCLIIENYYLLILIGIAAALASFALIKNGHFQGLKERKRQSWGIAYLPLSYLSLLLIWGNGSRHIAALSMLILAFADSLAAIFGGRSAKQYIAIKDKKTYAGSAIFFIVCLTVILLYNYAFPGFLNLSAQRTSDFYFILAVIYISFILTFIEGISYGGADNFFVPVIGSFLIYLCLLKNPAELVYTLWLGAALSAFVALASYKVKFLTKSGSAATFLLAAFIFGFGGLKWSIPIMAFFIFSSLLSKVKKGIKREVEMVYFEKTGVRDHWQVAANGGLGGILVLLNAVYPSGLFYIIYVSSLSAVCADTWATEIGTLRKTGTYNILTFRKIEQGMSGGVSLTGTLGGMLGSFVISLSGIWWIESNISQYIAVVVFAGVFGSFIDSLLGAAFQAQYRCEICGKITEKSYHCKTETAPAKGLSWLNNDMVNFLSGTCGGIIVIIFKEFLL